MPLDHQREKNYWQADQGGGGSDRSPVDLLKGHELEDGDWKCSRLVPAENEGEQEVVPGEDKAQDSRRVSFSDQPS
ncbi:MAG TPA: hypothetical protein VN648_25480, partial [Candidatus Methylomirabilis sp.]|nr:hypothetical protein [Candidatus Methylomirabilis sp.]